MYKFRKPFNLKNNIIFTLISIAILTIIFINTTSKKASNNMINIANELINTLNTNIVNNNIKTDILKKYNINDLISININENKITNVDYNMEKAYEVLIEIKNGIINNIENNMQNIYNYNYKVNYNNVMLEMPFYNYTNNLLIANFGPKVMAQISLIKLIDGSIKTKIKNYGINSLLVELYVNFTITNSIVVPSFNEKNNTNYYEILISSKVIQGEIPSLYDGLFEQSSNSIIS